MKKTFLFAGLFALVFGIARAVTSNVDTVGDYNEIQTAIAIPTAQATYIPSGLSGPATWYNSQYFGAPNPNDPSFEGPISILSRSGNILTVKRASNPKQHISREPNKIIFSTALFLTATMTPTVTLTKTTTPTRTPTVTVTPTVTPTVTLTVTPVVTNVILYAKANDLATPLNSVGAFGTDKLLAGTMSYDSIGGFSLFNDPTGVKIASDLGAGASQYLYIKSNGSCNFVGTIFNMGCVLNMQSHAVSAVSDPTSAQDAATKNYVDGLVPGGIVRGTVTFVDTTPVTVNINGCSSTSSFCMSEKGTAVASTFGWTSPAANTIVFNQSLAAASTITYIGIK
jgi:hypothetical protein